MMRKNYEQVDFHPFNQLLRNTHLSLKLTSFFFKLQLECQPFKHFLSYTYFKNFNAYSCLIHFYKRSKLVQLQHQPGNATYCVCCCHHNLAKRNFNTHWIIYLFSEYQPINQLLKHIHVKKMSETFWHLKVFEKFTIVATFSTIQPLLWQHTFRYFGQ